MNIKIRRFAIRTLHPSPGKGRIAKWWRRCQGARMPKDFNTEWRMKNLNRFSKTVKVFAIRWTVNIDISRPETEQNWHVYGAWFRPEVAGDVISGENVHSGTIPSWAPSTLFGLTHLLFYGKCLGRGFHFWCHGKGICHGCGVLNHRYLHHVRNWGKFRGERLKRIGPGVSEYGVVNLFAAWRSDIASRAICHRIRVGRTDGRT